MLAAWGPKGAKSWGSSSWKAPIGVVGAVIGCLAGAGIILLIRAAGGFDFTFAAGMGEATGSMGNRLALTAGDVVARGLIVAVIAAVASFSSRLAGIAKEPAAALHHR